MVLIGGQYPFIRENNSICRYNKGNKSCGNTAGGSGNVSSVFTTEFKSDAACAGEGEKVIVDLLEGLKSNKLMN